MAYANTAVNGSNFRTILTAPFVALSKLMDSLAVACAMAEDANRLMETSGAELTAKGLTREDAIQSVFSNTAKD